MSTSTQNRSSLVGIGLGGVICFSTMYLLLMAAQLGVIFILFSLNCLGLLAFEEAGLGVFLFSIAVVYLPAGFFCGTYAGRKINNRKIVLLSLPPVIAFTVLTIMRIFSNQVVLTDIDPVREVLAPLAAVVAGTYLGGFPQMKNDQK